MNFDWVALGTLATFLLALITFGTLLEMKKQRERSYMPDLIFQSDTIDQRFYLYKGTLSEEIQFMYWHKTNLKDEKLIETVRPFSFDIDCFNIGIGSAKNIKFKYEIDFEEMKSTIESLSSVTFDKFVVDKDNITFMGKFINVPIGGGVSQKEMCFSHVFIPQTSDKAFKIQLPSIYLSFFNAFVLSILRSKLYGTKFPKLKLQVSYQDIANKIYTKNFILSIKFESANVVYDQPLAFVNGIIIIVQTS